MLPSVLRSAGSIVLSLAVALGLVIAVEVFGAAVHPFPPGADTSDPEVIKAHVAKFPHWVLAVVAIAWGLTVFVSVWLATRLGPNRHPAHGIFVGLLLLSAVTCNMTMLPYPVWFEVTNWVIFPAAIYAAVMVGRGPRREG